MAINAATKFSLLAIRSLEWTFAVIALGVFGYFVSIQRDLDVKVQRETVTPLIASVLAVVFTTYTLLISLFSSKTLTYIGSFFDFISFVLWIASAGLYRHNFHVHGDQNPLQQYLIAAKRSRQLSDHHKMINGLVKLGAALIIMELIFYFFTWLISGWAAYNQDKTTTVRETPVREKRGSWFSSKRSSRDSDRAAASGSAPAAPEPAQQV